jgi:hypothetical protein
MNTTPRTPRLGRLPEFAHPFREPEPGPDLEDLRSPSRPGGPASAPEFPRSPEPDDPSGRSVGGGPLGARTGTFSGRQGSGDPKVAAAAIGGLLAIALEAIGWAISWRRGYVMRQPTVDELDDITGPLGNITVRHLPMSEWAPDLVDIGMSAKALRNYVRADEPLFYRQPPAETHGIEEI